MSTILAATVNTKMEAYWSGRLRGFMLKNSYDPNPHTAQTYADLAAEGANVVRVPFSLTKVSNRYVFPTTEVNYLFQVLNAGSLNGFKVIPVMVPLPAFEASEWWTDVQLQADIITIWAAVARIIKDHPALIGYDIINEPVGPVTFNTANKLLWLSISENICQAIRVEDRDTPILWEPFWWGVPSSFWLYPNPPTVSNLVASFHWYEPTGVTHQGLGTYSAAGTQAYPGVGVANSGYQGVYQDVITAYTNLVEARNFLKNFSIPAFIGEFSCIRWAPPGTTLAWLNDALKLFREEKWGGCYHAYDAYEGWDPKIPQSVAPYTALPSDRSASNPIIVRLREWFTSN